MNKSFSFVGGLILLRLITASAHADDLVMPPGVNIRAVTAQGSGCPEGSVSAAISPDGKAVSVIYDKYTVQSGLAVASAKMNCDVKLEMKVPVGYSFTLFSADYRGFADVEKDAIVAHEATYSFYAVTPASRLVPPSGPIITPRAPLPPPVFKAPISFSSKVIQGPYSGDYLINNQIPMGNAQWSACDTNEVKTLTIGTALLSRSVKRTAPHPTSTISLDTIDGAIAQEFDWAWKRCDNQPPALITTQIFMGDNGKDHMLSASISELQTKGYVTNIPVFKIFTQPQSSAQAALYQCNSSLGRFASVQASCEGATVEGLLGYVSSQPNPQNPNRIFRLKSKTNPADKIAVTNLRADPRYATNYIFEVILGYATN